MGLFSRRSKGPRRQRRAPEAAAATTPSPVTFLDVPPELRRAVVRDAKESGRKELPAVDGPEPIPEPPALSNWRNTFENACHGLEQQAAAQLAPVHRSLASLATQIRQGVITGQVPAESPIAQQVQHQQVLGQFEIEEARITEIQQGHEARLSQLQSNFDSLASDFFHELLRVHPDADILQRRWVGPAPFLIPDEALDFGQADARLIVTEINAFLAQGD